MNAFKVAAVTKDAIYGGLIGEAIYDYCLKWFKEGEKDVTKSIVL
jgi:hypothetical protein